MKPEDIGKLVVQRHHLLVIKQLLLRLVVLLRCIKLVRHAIRLERREKLVTEVLVDLGIVVRVLIVVVVVVVRIRLELGERLLAVRVNGLGSAGLSIAVRHRDVSILLVLVALSNAGLFRTDLL